MQKYVIFIKKYYLASLYMSYPIPIPILFFFLL